MNGMNIFISLAMLAILAALVGAGVFMLKRPGQGTQKNGRMAKALAVRVGLSVTLFAFVLIAYLLGWIEPKGIPLG
jgi:flagellar biogenesis protein FliO